MNRTRAGGIAAGLIAVGLMIGFAGTAVARDGSASWDCPGAMTEYMSSQGMTEMMSRMGGSMGPGMMGSDAPANSL